MKPRIRREIRTGVLVLAILALLPIFGAALLVHVLVDPTYYERILVSHIEERLHRQVTFTSAAVAFWPGLGIRLNDVAISKSPPEPGHPFLAMKALRVHVRLLPLLRKQFVIRRIVIEKPMIAVVRDARGRLSFADLLGRPEQQPRGAKRMSETIAQLLVAKTDIHQGDLSFVDLAVKGKPVRTQVSDLEVELEHLAYGKTPEVKLRARIGPREQKRRVEIEGKIGPLARNWRLSALPMEVEVRTAAFDLHPFLPYFPAPWHARLPRGVVTAHVSIHGRWDQKLTAEGKLHIEDLEFRGDSYRLTGTVDGDVEGSANQGVFEGKTQLSLLPGAFTKGSLLLEGQTKVGAAFRTGRGAFQAKITIDATQATYRQGDVFEKKPGIPLTLTGDLSRTGKRLTVRHAMGVLGHLPFSGEAEIGRALRPGRSTPFALHFHPDPIDLTTMATYVTATEPFALAGKADVSRLDILRRPEERRKWQVMLDFSVSGARALIPLDHGVAHTVEDLSAQVHIAPGLLTAKEGRASVNQVLLRFHGTAQEFMTMVTKDPDRLRADVRFEAEEARVDLDRLLAPAQGGPPPEGAVPTHPSVHAPSPENGMARAWEAPSPAGPPMGALPFLRTFVVSRGEIRAKEAIYAEQNVTDLDTIFGYDDPVLKLSNTRFGAYDGRWEVRGDVRLDGGPTFDLDLKARDARLEKLIAAFVTATEVHANPNHAAPPSPARVFGILDGHAELRGRGKNVKAWEKTLVGSGRVVVREGRLPSSNIMEAVVRSFLGLFRKIIPVRREVTLSEPTTFDRFDQAFEVQDGRVRTENIQLLTADYLLTGQGSFGLDSTLDYDTQVRLTPQGSQRMIVVASLPILNESYNTMAPIPVRITGTFENPSIRPDVSGMSIGKLRALIGGAMGGGAEMIKGGVGRVLGLPSKKPKE